MELKHFNMFFFFFALYCIGYIKLIFLILNGCFLNFIEAVVEVVTFLCVCFRAGDKDSSPPPPECLQLLSRATQVFREEYILKLGMAHEEMQRRYKIKLF